MKFHSEKFPLLLSNGTEPQPLSVNINAIFCGYIYYERNGGTWSNAVGVQMVQFSRISRFAWKKHALWWWYICTTIPVIVYTCNKHKAWTDIDIIFIFDQACRYDTTLFRQRRIVCFRITLPPCRFFNFTRIHVYTVYEIIELFVILVQDVHFIKVFLLKLVLMKSFCVINYRLKIFF